MRNILKIFSLLLISLTLIACSGDKKSSAEALDLKDGTYNGESNPDERGGIVKVSIDVKDSKISACTMENLDSDGRIKDENYGYSQNEGLYNIAQKAINLAASYPDELVKAGNPEGVDQISGATESYKQFIEACNNALQDARK